MNQNKIIGENLKKRRKELQLTQIIVAERLKVKRTTYSAWETGESKPTIDKLPKIAEVLLIDDLYLFLSKVF